MKRFFCVLALIMIILLTACGKDIEKEGQQTKQSKINVLLPQTPSSLPLYFALKDNPIFQVELFLNHSQANAKFLNGQAKLLLTGISVANSFSQQGVDFDILNSQVDNLTHLVGHDLITNFSQIKGRKIIFPFADSPMEVLFTEIAKQHNLVKNQDYTIEYMPFTTSLQVLQQGQDLLVWLPEPFVSLAEDKFNLKVGLSLDKEFRSQLADINACQVLLLARDLDLRTQGAIHYLSKVYIDSLKKQPEKFINRLPQDFPNRQAYNLRTLKRTSYNFTHGADLKSTTDSLFKLLNKENNLAERILELN